MAEKQKNFYLKTFGCAENTSDSERIKAWLCEQGMTEVDDYKNSEVVVINTCIVRESAENRAYGLIDQVRKSESLKSKKKKIIVTGCLVGAAVRKKELGQLKKRFPQVDEFIETEKIGFDWKPVRDKKKAGLLTISSGCNNFCTFCIVPFARGKEKSRPMAEVLAEAKDLIAEGFKEIVLIGQNVNSYGSEWSESTTVSMGKKRFKSMFPQLLAQVAALPFEKISFVSSNPWDFSDELIEVIKNNPNIDRLLHLPIQSGDDEILKRMNRSYTTAEYKELVGRIRKNIDRVELSTDIIVGFPGENEIAFNHTVELCQRVGFKIGYINKYSPRSGTVSAKLYPNDVPQAEKRRRWNVLNELINKK